MLASLLLLDPRVWSDRPLEEGVKQPVKVGPDRQPAMQAHAAAVDKNAGEVRGAAGGLLFANAPRRDKGERWLQVRR